MKDTVYYVEDGCRSCGCYELESVLSLGTPPLADRLVDRQNTARKEYQVPLNLVWCPICNLLQIQETVAPAVLFQDDYRIIRRSPRDISFMLVNMQEIS